MLKRKKKPILLSAGAVLAPPRGSTWSRSHPRHRARRGSTGSDGRAVGAPPHEREALAVPDLPAKPRPKPNTPMHPGHTHTRRRASDCYQASGGVPPGGEPPGNGSTTGLPSMVGTHFPMRSSKCCPSRATSCGRNRGLAAAPNCHVVGATTSDCRQRKSSGGAAVAGTAGG